jgi:hypothetical protein
MRHKSVTWWLGWPLVDRSERAVIFASSGGTHVLSDGLTCFRAVTTANCLHKAVVTSGKHPTELPQFRWINTLLGNLKTSFSGTFHAFNFDKYASQYLGG